MAIIALKIDVDTYHGTRDGVGRLLKLLKSYAANATFLFSLGKDHTGRAIKRIFRPGFFNKVCRTSVIQHYGLRTLCYGVLLPAPDIGLRCADSLRRVAEEGFEVGIHCWDHVAWQDNIVNADIEWTRQQLMMAQQRFTDIFGVAAKVHGAAGWQMNRAAYRLEQQLQFDYASDTRGSTPFWPIIDGEPVHCVQLPTTLATLDELIGLHGLTEANVSDYLLEQTRHPPEYGHVYTLHAELEGGKWLCVFEQLLQGWQQQGYACVSMRQLLNSLNLAQLPYHQIAMATIPGRSGKVACQAENFPGEGTLALAL